MHWRKKYIMKIQGFLKKIEKNPLCKRKIERSKTDRPFEFQNTTSLQNLSQIENGRMIFMRTFLAVPSNILLCLFPYCFADTQYIHILMYVLTE